MFFDLLQFTVNLLHIRSFQAVQGDLILSPPRTDYTVKYAEKALFSLTVI